MKYFENISSIEALRAKYNELIADSRPDVSCIDKEFDTLYAALLVEKKAAAEKAAEKKEHYTENGWAGSRYTSGVTLKEIASKVKGYAKEHYPCFKFSVRSQNYSGYSVICITLVSGGVPAILSDRSRISGLNNLKLLKSEISEEAYDAVNDVYKYAQSYNYNDSDSEIDYYDVNFYLRIDIGRWDKPYEVK